jgi:septum formation inhibitor-activating ATPase MinD
MEKKDETQKSQTGDKDTLSQEDIKSGVNNLNESDQPHPALETADGKNNGAEPAVFKNQRKAHP